MNIRHNQLLELLKKKKFVTVAGLSALLYASEATIRRDLIKLQDDGLIQRTRGGAVYVEAAHLEWPLLFKNQVNSEKKQIIAGLAADFIKDQQTAFIDSSSTCMALAKRFSEKKGLTILTNGVMTSSILSETTDAEVYCACGKIYSKRSSIHGADTCEYVSRFRADIAFVSCRGIAADVGIMDFSNGDSMVKRAFRKHAKKLVLLADSTKHGQSFFHKTFDFSDVDIVVTDRSFPDDIAREFVGAGAEIVTP